MCKKNKIIYNNKIKIIFYAFFFFPAQYLQRISTITKTYFYTYINDTFIFNFVKILTIFCMHIKNHINIIFDAKIKIFDFLIIVSYTQIYLCYYKYIHIIHF
ncbi:hypothetical protein YYC_02492 [Plasmodium yoelii 17X]|uniref:Uncharacterized protein n=1 Tax=Plasmodium yoelii 17X TaxID=1323249 RepID=V7PPA1_PLAYE|nr:hypothetical protein YYC_02492 [Plasmodium yoelii 17X]